MSDTALYASGTYRITADTVTPVPLGEIEPGGGVLGVDEPSGGVWSFDAISGQVVDVNVAVTSDAFFSRYHLHLFHRGGDSYRRAQPEDDTPAGRWLVPGEHGRRHAARSLRSLRTPRAGGAGSGGEREGVLGLQVSVAARVAVRRSGREIVAAVSA